MKRGKSRLLSGLLSVAMAFSAVSIPIEAFAATDTTGHWAEASINNWINRGYISGYPDGTFRPNNAISRAEFVTIANKAFGFTSSQGISFDDVKPGYWAYGEIQKGVAAGYIQGDTNGNFRPGSEVTRQEAAVMLASLKKYDSYEAGVYNYTDRWAMANWAVGSIGAVSRNGVMSGYPDGTFRPQQSLTRAEAVAALQKVASSSNVFTSTNNTSSNYVTTNNTSRNSSSNLSSSSARSSNDNDYGFNGIVLEGTRMENRNLTRDLLIPRSLGSQNVTLKNVRLKGTLYVEGGSNITLENCNITTVVMDRTNAVLKNNGSSDIEEVRFEEEGRLDGKGYGTVLIDNNSISEVIIDADIDTLILDAEVDLRLYANSNIDTFEVTKNADKAKIKIGEDAEVSDMQIYDKVRISGKGKIDVMTVYVSGVRSEIEPRRLIQQDSARKPNFNYTDDDDDDDDDYDNLTLNDDDEDFDGDGEKYHRVRISAEDVTVSDLTVYDDLTITSSAGDSTIRLEDITVRGNVYVEGGGDSSVIFDDCSINGNIYSRKNTSGRYDEAVAIKLRDTTVRGDIYVTGDTILESNTKLKKVILNRELSKTFRMDANADSLIINYNNTVQMRGSCTIDTAEVASGLNNVSITMDGGKFGTFTVRSPIRIDGTGTIDKLVTGETNDIGSSITIGTTETIPSSGTTPSGSHIITASANDTNGSISPSGQQTVANGSTKEFTITANAGYHIRAIVVDNNEVNLENNLYQGYTYTFNNVTANHEIIVSFEPGAGTNGNGSGSNGTPSGDNPGNNPSQGDYTITTTVNGSGGSADNMLIPVKDGEDASVKFTADNDYHISKIVIDEGTAAEQNLKRISDSTVTFKEVTYTFKNVTKDHTISVTFADGQGTNEIGILSTDEDVAILKPSGYKYEVKTELYDAKTGKPLKRNDDGRYYCIAGDRVTLNMLSFETDNPNKEYLKTRWAVVNSTTNMEMELFQRDGENIATLQTTAGSGYAAILKVQVYDTNKESTVPIASSDVAELHVDVPLQELRLNSLNCQTNQFSLSSQNLTFIPETASAANNKQNIQWEVIGVEIEEVSKPLIPDDEPVEASIVDIGKEATIYALQVRQYYKETAESQLKKLVQQPMGKVIIKATIPNGLGNMQDYSQTFEINFVGTTVIPVSSITIEASDRQSPKEVNGIAELDLSKIGVQIRPSDATFKTIEWEIDQQLKVDGETVSETPLLGRIIEDKDRRNTVLETTGYPGQIVLRPYIKNGRGAEGDFDTEKDTEERVRVNILPVIPIIRANNIGSTNGTDEGDTITLSAQVTNADKTPYTKIMGWEKTTKENPKDDDWEDINIKETEFTESGNGTYTANYIIKKDDLKENHNYDSNIVYFRAYTIYDKIDGTSTKPEKVYSSNIVSVDCHAQAIKLPDRTGYNQVVSVDNNKTCTITGYDTLTLSKTLDNGNPITWSIDLAEGSPIAELKDNVLTVKGQPNQSFKLTATVDDKGPTTFTINTAFQEIDKKSSGFDIVNAAGTPITVARPGDTIYLMLGNTSVNPKHATYHAYKEEDKVSWSMGTSADGSDAQIISPTPVEGSNGYPYKISESEDIETDENGKIYFTASWKNGALTTSGNVVSIQSNTVGIEIKKSIEPIQGLNFENVTNLINVKQDGNDYVAEIQGSADRDVSVILTDIKVLSSGASAEGWSLVESAENIATFTQEKLITVKKGNKAGTIKLKLSIKNGLGEGKPYEATLTITIKAAPEAPAPPATSDPEKTTNTQTEISETENIFNLPLPADEEIEESVNNENPANEAENNTQNVGAENNVSTEPENNVANESNENNKVDEIPFVAVSDIDFNDISGLQRSANTYTITSDSTKQTTLHLADSTTTIDGVTKHTGIEVLPANATNKTVTWRAKNSTLTAVPNIVDVNGMGTLNQNTNTFIINANTSGTVTLVATVANGKAENVDFVKELTIHIDKPAGNTIQTVQNTITPSTSSTTPSSTTTASKMPSNTTQATTKQVVSVGTTSVGTSSVTSASTSKTKDSTNITSAVRNTSNSDVKIEVSGQCKKGISIPLKAVSKSTQKEYTDVDWEITNDGGTNAKITSGNRLRATSTGTVTVTATVYTSSGTIVCSTNIAISN